MTDYKGIHAKFQREDHDYRAGWREEREGLWFALGLGVMAIIALVLV